MKTDPYEINRYLTESRNCALQMMQNAAYMQKELPSLEMSDGLREEIEKLCDDLISTKHDLIAQIFECYELLEEDSDAQRIGKMINQMHQWNPVENQVAIGIDVETFLWEIEGLVNQVKVSIGTVHLSQRFKWLSKLALRVRSNYIFDAL